jgi:hypothetical protein
VNKTIAGIVLAAVLCCVGGPFATGLIAESHLETRVAAIDANNSWISAGILSYDRGWFSSQAVIELALRTEDGQAPPYAALAGLLGAQAPTLPVSIAISHGPVGFHEGLFVGVARVTAQPDPSDERIGKLNAMLAVPYLFEFRGRSDFGGRFDFDADVPPFTLTAALGDIRFSGLAVDGTAVGRHLTVSGAFDEAGLEGMFAAGSIGSVAFDLDYEFRPDRLPLSRGTFTLGHVLATSPMLGNDPLLDVAGLSIEQLIAMSADNETIDASVRYASERLVVGAGTDLSDVDLGIRLDGLDSQAATDYYAVMDRAIEEPALDDDALMIELEPVLEALVRRGFTIEIEPAAFASPLGTLDANALVTVDGTDLPAGSPVDVRNIAVLLGVLAVDADLLVTKALARDLAARSMRSQLEAGAAASGEPFSEAELDAAAEAQAGLMLATLSGQGMLEDDGTRYRATLRFVEGALTVNGASLGAGLF